jgi:hypothetical protein
MAKEAQYAAAGGKDRKLAEEAQSNYEDAFEAHTGLQWLAAFNLGHAESLIADFDTARSDSLFWRRSALEAAKAAVLAADDLRRVSRSFNNVADSDYKIAWSLYRRQLQLDRKLPGADAARAAENAIDSDRRGIRGEIDTCLSDADQGIIQSIAAEDTSESAIHHATRAEILCAKLVIEIEKLDLKKRQSGSPEADSVDARFREIEKAYEASNKITPKFIRGKNRFLNDDAYPFHILMERLRSINVEKSKTYESRLLKAAGYE